MAELSLSKELGAMAQIEQALQDLSEDERGRVLAWACSRFGMPITGAKSQARYGMDSTESSNGEEGDDAENESDEAESLAEFYDRASPRSDGEKALVAGYWIQVRDGASELEAQKINSELKHLGHGISNVTRALEWLKSQKPALMIQKRKDGSTRQARKKFVVTNEGKKYVEKMLRLE